MRCEVLDEAVPVLSMGPFSREAVRRLACHPEELGLEPLCPDAAEGSIFTLLNWLRAIIRETEVAAAFAFRKQDGTLERPRSSVPLNNSPLKWSNMDWRQAACCGVGVSIGVIAASPCRY